MKFFSSRLRYYFTIVFTALVAAYVTFCTNNKDNSYYSTMGVIWATEYHITFQGNSNLADSILPTLQKVDYSLSFFNDKSLLSRINRNETDSTDLFFNTVYNCAKQISKKSNGYYDPTIAPLVNFWGFGRKQGTIPSATQIDSIMQFIGIDKTNISNNILSKTDARTIFDFSSIAKGFGCDAVGEMFKRNNVENFIIEIGGEVVAHGVNARNEQWHVSIDQPITQADTVIHSSASVIMLKNSGMATSGNYRNFKKIGDKTISHIINPKTGQPEISNLLSATIVAPSSMLADGYATACMVIGLDKSIDLLNSNPTLAGFLIYNDGGELKIWASENFKALQLQ